MTVETIRLQRFPIFADLSPEILEAVGSFSSRVHFEPNQRIFAFGDPADCFYLVEYGRIKVFRTNPAGREQVLHVVEGGQSLAEVAVLSLDFYPADAMALADTAAIKVPRGPFNDLISTHGEAARAMLAGQARWLRHIIDLTSALLLDDIRARLARYLVVQAASRRLPWRDEIRVDLEVKKNVIAAQLGTTPETLSRTFGRLERAKLIRREGKAVIILDSSTLHDLAYP